VWQGLNEEFAANGITVITIGTEVNPAQCYPFMDKSGATHPQLIDKHHATVSALGFINVPMAMWVEANGTIVQPAHHSPVTPGWGDRPMPEGLPPRIAGRFEVLKQGTDRHQEYLTALRRWATDGVALDPEVARSASGMRTHDEAMAVACFELGDHLRKTVGDDASVPWWREAHRLDPNNWAAKRQAWSLITTAPGAAPDLMQEDTGPYDGNWLDDVLAVGGIDNYYPPTSW
jgi:hypothetical protein